MRLYLYVCVCVPGQRFNFRFSLPIRLFFNDNVRNDSGPFNDELGTDSSRLSSNFSSWKNNGKRHYKRVVRAKKRGRRLPPGSRSLWVCPPPTTISDCHSGPTWRAWTARGIPLWKISDSGCRPTSFRLASDPRSCSERRRMTFQKVSEWSFVTGPVWLKCKFAKKNRLNW